MNSKYYKSKAKEALKGNWGIMIGITLIYALIVSACSTIPAGALIVTGPMMVGLYIAFVNLIRGTKPEIPMIFDGFSKSFLQSLLLYLLNTIFISLWTLLFIVPGIMKSYAYSMSYYIMADYPEMSQSEARTASMSMMDGHKWRLFCLHFSFVGWFILGAFTFGILYIWLVPYMQAANAAFYEDLKAATPIKVETV